MEETGRDKVGTGRKKKRIPAALLFLAAACLISGILLVPDEAEASGLIEVVGNGISLYCRYGIQNYDLDFYVDMSWTWLPWNWTDGIGRSVMYAFYGLTNILWYFSRVLSFFTGEAVSEAYRLDIVSEISDTVGANMQRLAGVGPSGFAADGYYPGFIMLVILVTGCYVAYTGLLKREVSRALGAAVNALVIFLCTTAFIVYAPVCIRSINEFSADISTGALELGTGFVMPGSQTAGGDSVDQIRDSLFSIQVYQPWLLMQFGTTDVNAVGADRVERLLATDPDADYGRTREEIIKEEIGTYGNTRMTTTKVMARFGEALFILVINLLISIFVLLLAGTMIVSQVLFILYAMFLPVSFVLAMFPTFNGLAKKALMNLFNVILLRAGYVLIITVTFSVSTMVYGLAGDHSFVMVGFLQILVFAGVFFNRGSIMEMMSLQEDRGARRLGFMAGAPLVYGGVRKVSRGLRNAADKVKSKVKKAVAGGFSRAGGAAKQAGENFMDHRLQSFQREQAAQRSAESARRRNELDYTSAEATPGMVSAGFDREVTAKQLYNRYYNRAQGRELGREEFYDSGITFPEEERQYHAAERKGVPEVRKMQFVSESRNNMTSAGVTSGTEARDKTDGTVFPGTKRPYHAAERKGTPAVRKARFTANGQSTVAGPKLSAVQETAPGRKKRYHAAERRGVPEVRKMQFASESRSSMISADMTSGMEARKMTGTTASPDTERPYHAAERKGTPAVKRVQPAEDSRGAVTGTIGEKGARWEMSAAEDASRKTEERVQTAESRGVPEMRQAQFRPGSRGAAVMNISAENNMQPGQEPVSEASRSAESRSHAGEQKGVQEARQVQFTGEVRGGVKNTVPKTVQSGEVRHSPAGGTRIDGNREYMHAGADIETGRSAMFDREAAQKGDAAERKRERAGRRSETMPGGGSDT